MANVLLDAAGQRVPGHLDDSAGKGTPGVLLLPEWWGVNAHIVDVAARIAKAGFRVFAVDFYEGRVAKTEEEAKALSGAVNREAALSLVLRATAAMRARVAGKKVGVMGFCFGGSVALAAAARIPGISACVAFYGLPDVLDASQIRGAVQGHFAAQDDWCTPAKVDELEAKLARSGVRAEIFRYEAKHAFFNDSRPEVFSASAAALAWERAVGFLGRELK